MLSSLLALAALNLALLAVLLLRRPSPALPDPRVAHLAESLSAQLTRTDARSEAGLAALDQHLRAALADIRRDLATEAQATRDASTSTNAGLRTEVAASITQLGTALHAGLDLFRTDNKASAETLRTAVHANLSGLTDRLNQHLAEGARAQLDAQHALHTRLSSLTDSNLSQQEKLRSTVGDALLKLNADNEAKLEQMRATVDEKLQATLHTRLTESFGQVTDQLTKVHAGLGEMTKLSAGVDDLSRIFTNVKARGQFAEAMLDNLLKQMLAPSQFVRNAQVKPDTQEVVEFAVRFPGPNGDVLLPIDSKFPRETSDRLESAYESGSAADIASARKAFENAIRTEAKRICAKYIHEPVTTPNAVMFLPTEGLYAEVMRRDGLHDDIQQNCKVMIAGPSNLAAILTSFQMVFQLVNLQKKGSEVWNVLAAARGEFGKFGGLMDKMDKQVGTVQNTIRDLSVRTRAINRTLREVSAPADTQTSLLEFDAFTPPTLSLAASEESE